MDLMRLFPNFQRSFKTRARVRIISHLLIKIAEAIERYAEADSVSYRTQRVDRTPVRGASRFDIAERRLHHAYCGFRQSLASAVSAFAGQVGSLAKKL